MAARPLHVTSPRLASMSLSAACRSAIKYPMASIILQVRAKQVGLNLPALSLIFQPIGSIGNRQWSLSAPSTTQHRPFDPRIPGLIARQSLVRLALHRAHGGNLSPK